MRVPALASPTALAKACGIPATTLRLRLTNLDKLYGGIIVRLPGHRARVSMRRLLEVQPDYFGVGVALESDVERANAGLEGLRDDIAKIRVYLAGLQTRLSSVESRLRGAQ